MSQQTFPTEEPATQRERRRGDPKHHARHDQHRDAGREGGQDRGGTEGTGTDQQQTSAPDAVAQRAHRDQKAGQHEAIAVGDPEELRAARVQVRRQPRQR
jgi:hypothetical protein